MLLVGDPDRAYLDALLLQLGRIRVRSFVASRARKEHGLRRAVQLTFGYLHGCKTDRAGKTHCKRARCSLELGAIRADSTCFGRLVGEQAVFRASAGLCKAAHRPVASRQVVTAAMYRLASITLKQGGKTRRLVRTPGRGWRRPKEISPRVWSSATGALLQLAPLMATSVIGYGRGDQGTKILTVLLRVQSMPPIVLQFFHSGSDPARRWMVREGLPLRYEVPASMLDGLLSLARSK